MPWGGNSFRDANPCGLSEAAYIGQAQLVVGGLVEAAGLGVA